MMGQAEIDLGQSAPQIVPPGCVAVAHASWAASYDAARRRSCNADISSNFENSIHNSSPRSCRAYSWRQCAFCARVRSSGSRLGRPGSIQFPKPPAHLFFFLIIMRAGQWNPPRKDSFFSLVIFLWEKNHFVFSMIKRHYNWTHRETKGEPYLLLGFHCPALVIITNKKVNFTKKTKKTSVHWEKK